MKPVINAFLTDRLTAVLQPVVQDSKPLDKALSALFLEEKWSVQLQALAVQLSHLLMRGLNFYEALAKSSFTQNPSLVWQVLASWHDYEVYGQSLLPRSELVAQATLLPEGIQQGCPEWLDRLGQAELGEQWHLERAALFKAPARYVRVNRLKADKAKVQQLLKSEGIETAEVALVDTALEIKSDCALFRSQAFQQGLIEQQDAGSQLVAQALQVHSGARVIDACAGAGGKSLALAGAMQGKGRVLAMDVEQWKLDNLQKRAKRAGASNIETRLITSSKTIKRLADKADFLLLDVPCSGSGVLRRNPEAKWQQPMRLEALQELQRDILFRYSKMLVEGGELVYATCSLFPSENQAQVAWFLEQRSDFKLVAQQQISPAETGFDGFYWARLTRVKRSESL